MTRIMERVVSGEGTSQDLDDLYDVAGMIGGNTICPLGDAASFAGAEFCQEVQGRVRGASLRGQMSAASGRRARGEEI